MLILNILPNGVRLVRETLINSYSINQTQKLILQLTKIITYFLKSY